MTRCRAPFAGPALKFIAFTLSLVLLLLQNGHAGVVDNPSEKNLRGNQNDQKPEPILPAGRSLLRVAICQGVAGSEVLKCRVSGRPPVDLRTDYFDFVSAGWRLSQVVSDCDTKLLIYFFERDPKN